MPRLKTGRDVPCLICGVTRYRCAAYIERNARITCGSVECKTAMNKGANNPFWGKTHSQETVDKINASIRARPTPRRKGGPPKGWSQTPEQKAVMSAAMKERWRLNRDKMTAALPRGEDHHFRKINYEARYRSNFSTAQRREWTGTQCIWCSATDNLVLDHIIPVLAGGKAVKANAQTLCQPCNLWKMWNVDRPFYLAGLGSQEGQT